MSMKLSQRLARLERATDPRSRRDLAEIMRQLDRAEGKVARLTASMPVRTSRTAQS